MTTLKKSTAFFGVLICLLFSTTACSQSTNASKNYITENVPVTEFDRIKLIGSSDLIYTQSTNGKTSVQIYSSENLIDMLEVKVTGRTLEVRFKNKPNIISFGKSGKLQVIASSPSIQSAVLEGSGDIILKGNIQTSTMDISLSGSGDIKAEGDLQAQTSNIQLKGSGDIKLEDLSANAGNILLKGSGDINVRRNCHVNNLKINLSGSGDIKVAGINSTTTSALLQGSGDMELRGTAQTATIELNNSGNIKASGLQTNNATTILKGSGNISCYAIEKLKVNIKGSGEVGYKGNPSIETSISGSGKLFRL